MGILIVAASISKAKRLSSTSGHQFGSHLDPLWLLLRVVRKQAHPWRACGVLSRCTSFWKSPKNEWKIQVVRFVEVTHRLVTFPTNEDHEYSYINRSFLHSLQYRNGLRARISLFLYRWDGHFAWRGLESVCSHAELQAGVHWSKDHSKHRVCLVQTPHWHDVLARWFKLGCGVQDAKRGVLWME